MFVGCKTGSVSISAIFFSLLSTEKLSFAREKADAAFIHQVLFLANFQTKRRLPIVLLAQKMPAFDFLF